MQNAAMSMEKLMRAQADLLSVVELPYEYNARELVFSVDKIKLYHYQSTRKNCQATPVLVVFATVNRPEILDLFPERSFIRGLLDSGLDVYLLDWGYPDAADKEINIERYVTVYLHQCIEFICKAWSLPKINLLGICQGGLLSILYSAIYPAIKKLILISTPIDFETRNDVVANILKKIDVSLFTSPLMNVPGEWLSQFFVSLRLFELTWQKYSNYFENFENVAKTRRFLQVEKWIKDAPDQPAVAFQELIQHFFQENQLIKNHYHLAGRLITLKTLTMPILNIMAKDDEIIPPKSSRALKKHIAPHLYSERIYPSGHIGIYISDKVGKKMPAAIARWLKK